MAKTVQQSAVVQAQTLIEDARKGIFKSVYLLMGEEPFYVDRIAEAIIEHAIADEDKDFNQYICYGSDVTADDVITAARRYPMFAERQLVVVKEAQMMKDYEEIALYCEHPSDTTILVICLRGAKADKRRGLYKNAQKVGVVFESTPVKDYKMPEWISSYYASLGLQIEPVAADLLAEYAGTDLGKIAIETEKMRKNLPEDCVSITVKDIEENIGISRQMSVFELCNALSQRNASSALKISANLASLKGFSMVPSVSMLYLHFYKLLKNAILRRSRPGLSSGERAALLGVIPYHLRNYDDAMRLWPEQKCMTVISLLKEYDYKGKGGDGGDLNEPELFQELVSKILTT